MSAPATGAEACAQLDEAAAQLGARCSGGALDAWRRYEMSILDCGAYGRHVAEGLVEYHPELLASCLAKFAASCTEASPYPCQYEVLGGKLADGQTCADDEVCGTTSACLRVASDACSGVCVRLAVENETCGLYCGGAAPCEPGVVCGGGLTCRPLDVGGTCMKASQLGEACGGPDEVACAFPATCDRDPGDLQSNAVCAVPQSGGACRSDEGCPGSEFCFGGTCTPRRPANMPCADAPTGCEVWTFCDPITSLCVPAGDTCQPCAAFPPFSFAFACHTGTCNFGVTPAVCGPPAQLGDSCASVPCVPGLSCSASTSTCVQCPN